MATLLVVVRMDLGNDHNQCYDPIVSMKFMFTEIIKFMIILTSGFGLGLGLG